MFVFSYFLACLLNVVRGKMEGFVVGGGYTNITQYPHAAFISVYCGDDWVCGSSVLNQRILITAAHCISGCSLKKQTDHIVTAFLGHESITKAKLQRYASAIIPHKNYNEYTVDNDIGLIILSKAVPLSDTIKRIIVPRRFPKSGYEGFVAGWGDTGGNLSDILKHVHQKLGSKTICRQTGQIRAGTFCAGNSHKGTFPSSGDSGSGLITLNSYFLLGLVSYKNPLINHLIVYTNVTYHFAWIQNNSKMLYCEN